MQLQFESLDIPLNKLMPWDGNVRSSGLDPELPELAASIASHGILQAFSLSLVATPSFAYTRSALARRPAFGR